jgi:hypothetical protein
MTDGFFDRFGLPPTKPPRKLITERQQEYEPKPNEVKPARFVGPASPRLVFAYVLVLA